MAYVVTEPCIGVKDHSCVDVCPVGCIYEGEDQVIIHPEECIDCGACAPECPVEAIFEDSAVPDRWRHYIAKNARAFQVDASPPKSPYQEKWQAQRTQEGSAVRLYYLKHRKT
jgi:NAD-dependent dihydropyrimidine dehydrogenase PreA subunit